MPLSRRGDLPTDIGPMAAHIDSFALLLQVAERSHKTIAIYTDAARWLAQWLHAHTDIRRWDHVSRDQLVAFFLHMQAAGYEQGYRSNIARALQAFFKWYADEEQVPNPYATFRAPSPRKLGERVPTVISPDDMRLLLRDAEAGRDFTSRRDAALLRVFACTGGRLAEITGLRLADVDIKGRTALVTGKGSRQRVLRFDAKAALALDRYLRKRAEHRSSVLPALWLGSNRDGPMTASGVRQAIQRRARRLGLTINPHLFRHTFSHNWLDEGGAEGDLMELNGWDSPQMLRHYGASARGARARRAYDRINVMKDV